MVDSYIININLKKCLQINDFNISFDYKKLGACINIKAKLLRDDQIINESQEFCIYNTKLKLIIVVKNNVLCISVANMPILITTISLPFILNFDKYDCSKILLDTIDLLNPNCKLTPLINLEENNFGWILTFSEDTNINEQTIKISDNVYISHDLDYIKFLIKNNSKLISVEPDCISTL